METIVVSLVCLAYIVPALFLAILAWPITIIIVFYYIGGGFAILPAIVAILLIAAWKESL